MYKNILEKLYNTSLSLRTKNNLYFASTSQEYSYCWLRDVYYQALPLIEYNPELYQSTYHTLLDYFHKVEDKYGKFTNMIKYPESKKEAQKYLHARLNVNTLDEIPDPWGNRQNDSVASVLLGIVQGEQAGIKIIRDEKDKKDIRIINLIIKYLNTIEYWHDKDNGIWEENTELHASSIGACVSALKALKQLNHPDINISEELIQKGQETLNKLLPRESVSKECDMALLTLIYPFNVVTAQQKAEIIHNVETQLLREYGCIRYIQDGYFAGKTEAEWSLGDLFLAIIYADDGNIDKSKYHLHRIIDRCKDGKIPELWKDGNPNQNNPLGWSLSLCIIAINKINKLNY